MRLVHIRFPLETYVKGILSQKQKVFVQFAKWLEQTSGHNECCSAPSPHSVPACDLCERRTFTKHKKTSCKVIEFVSNASE